jgi:hypothetical protein
VRVDLSKFKFVIGGVKVEGIADSLNLQLPAKRPEGLCVCCQHLDWDDPFLMVKGSVFQHESGEPGARICRLYILCKACVIAHQYFDEGAMQAQARICPICFDDHSERRPCKNADLIDRVYELEEMLAVIKVAAIHRLDNPEASGDYLKDLINNGKKAESYSFYLEQLKGKQ